MTKLADLSITRKLALVVLATSMITLAVASISLGVYDRQQALQSIRERSGQLSSLLATNSSAALLRLFPVVTEALEARLASAHQPDTIST